MVYNNKEKRDSTIDLYSIVIYMTTLQTILTIIAIDNFEYKIFNIITTFFNAIISKDINIFVK